MTSNFTISEFLSKDGAPTPPNVVHNLHRLAAALEVLRIELGNVPIKINSAYRSPSHNQASGGSLNSQHLYGLAADITTDNHTPEQIVDAINNLRRYGVITDGGVGLYDTFVHFDIRGENVYWNSKKKNNNLKIDDNLKDDNVFNKVALFGFFTCVAFFIVYRLVTL